MYSGLYTGVQLILSYNHKKHDKASRIWLSLTQHSLSQKAPEEKFGNTQPLSVKIQTQSKIYNSHIPVLKNRHLLGGLWTTWLQSDENSSCLQSDVPVLGCRVSTYSHTFAHWCVRAVLSDRSCKTPWSVSNFQVTKSDAAGS